MWAEAADPADLLQEASRRLRYSLVRSRCVYCGKEFWHYVSRPDRRRKCCDAPPCQRAYRLRKRFRHGPDPEERADIENAKRLAPGARAVLADGRYVGEIVEVDPKAGLVAVREKCSLTGYRTVYCARFLVPEDSDRGEISCGAC